MEDSEQRDFGWWYSHENHVTHGQPVRLDLFVRTLGAPVGSHSRQAAILDQVERLDQRDAIDASRVTVWGDSICVSECCSKNATVRSIRDRIDAFREWAQEKREVSMRFDRREVDCSVTGERFEVIDLPTMCLAVYVDSALEGVFPATIGGEEWTVESYLDWFERARGRADARIVADA